jgi:PAS domain S-box-containing protein
MVPTQHANAVARPRTELYRAVFENAPDAILLVDDDRRLLDGNRAARSFLGVSREELTRHRIDDFSAPHALQDLERIWSTLMNTGVLEGRYPMRLSNGLERTVTFHAVARITAGRHMASLRLADEAHARLVSPRQELTAREREVLTHVARGASARQIAEAASLSPETVRTHLRNAMRKLDATSRPHAVALAIKGRHIEA